MEGGAAFEAINVEPALNGKVGDLERRVDDVPEVQRRSGLVLIESLQLPAAEPAASFL